MCDNSHEHDDLTSGGSERCKLWTWNFAGRVIEGISLLKKATNSPRYAFPSIGTGITDAGDIPVGEAWRKCPGRLGRFNKTDPRHTRIVAQCKHPLVQSIIYDCEGCRLRKPVIHESHTYEDGHCRLWLMLQFLQGQARHAREVTHVSLPFPPLLRLLEKLKLLTWLPAPTKNQGLLQISLAPLTAKTRKQPRNQTHLGQMLMAHSTYRE